jgi:hypothetical protein
MKLISSLLQFVSFTSQKYNIDESHGLGHSMDVLINANQIFNSEVKKHPFLSNQERIIYTSTIIHDMCDKKYMNESQGILEIELFLKNKMKKSEIDMTKEIISKMSYSTVKKNGFPNLNEYQLAYHIVREADLLAAYDIDRCIIYNMNRMNGDLLVAYNNAKELFENRVFKHFSDELFITDFSKNRAKELEMDAHSRLKNWENIINRL